jgi:Peptidase family C25
VKRIIPVLALLVAAALSQPYDHVVITSSTLALRFAPLGAFIESSLGLNDTVVTTTAIYAQFPGRDNPERIRNFIKYAYSNWGTTHVLLGGDVEVVPCRYCFVRRGSTTENVPCELYYSDLDRDWDANRNNIFGEPDDSVDMRPNVFLGRVPASTAGSVDIFTNKFTTYSSDPNAAYLRDVFLNGFDLYLSPVIYGEIACELYDTTLVPSSMRPCTKVYDSHTGDHKIATLAALNQGPHIWVHADHCGWNCMGVGWTNHRQVLELSDLNALTNGPNYTILTSVGCDVGAFDSADCDAEVFTYAPNGGGVAVLANSRAGLLKGPDWHRMASFLQVEYTLYCLFNHGGNASLEDLARVQGLVAPLADTSETYRWCQYQYLLFGEPAMPVWVPGASGAETREKSELRREKAGPTVVRGRLVLPEAAGGGRSTVGACLLDAAGRRVLDLHPGANDLSQLPPGVYFVFGIDSDDCRVLLVR